MPLPNSLYKSQFYSIGNTVPAELVNSRLMTQLSIQYLFQNTSIFTQQSKNSHYLNGPRFWAVCGAPLKRPSSVAAAPPPRLLLAAKPCMRHATDGHRSTHKSTGNGLIFPSGPVSMRSATGAGVVAGAGAPRCVSRLSAVSAAAWRAANRMARGVPSWWQRKRLYRMAKWRRTWMMIQKKLN
jgi:hypothetical protein